VSIRADLFYCEQPSENAIMTQAQDLKSEPVAVGKAADRVDGRAKVTGRATYAADAPVQGVAYAQIVQTTIAKGTVKSIDDTDAKSLPGVLAIITPGNMPKIKSGKGGPPERRLPLSDMKVHHAGQHLAVVVADTPERAAHAASMLKIEYEAEPPVTSMDDAGAVEEKPNSQMGEPTQYQRGDVERALAGEGLKVIRATYQMPVESHNPMEMSATVAAWDGDERLTVWDSTQHVVGRQESLASTLGLKQQNVRVLCLYVGGAFGCKGVPWPHAVLAAVAAKMVGRPVKLMLTRPQMFTSCGHRPEVRQAMTLAAAADGKLVAIRHDTTMHGSTIGDFVEPSGTRSSYVLYETPNLQVTHTVRRVNVATPTYMRAPGETPGTYALECAMDELAVALKMDPVQLRLVNYAERHPSTNKPWSTKNLKEIYRLGAEKFGWNTRNPATGGMRSKDGKLIGWGMATASYPARKFPGSARIRLMKDSDGGLRATGAAATHDLGTGAYTVCTQMTADQVGLPAERVAFELGDTNLPPSGVSGGSTTTASVATALGDAGLALRANLLKLANDDKNSPLAELGPEQVVLRGNRLVAKGEASRSVDIVPLIAKSGRAYVEGASVDAEAIKKTQKPGGSNTQPAVDFAFHSFGAHFVEVTVDHPVPTIRVRRVVSVMDVGRVVNPKTAGSQVIGGVVMGIGMALFEGTHYDTSTGRPINDNLADYAVCVNPDIESLEPYFVGEPDLHSNPVGCRGIGEIGITGVAAAVANAIYHATGKRVRDLPITPDKLL
jgi:xanthine dehydrogenase YagR molybdenum-binding subunit